MSGDYTTYLRGREYERDGPDVSFMRDGFDRWAESDAPFRAGGALKTPADRSSRYRRSLRSHRGRGHPSDGEDYDNCSEDGHRFVGGRRAARSRSRSSSRSSRSSRSSFYSDSEDDMRGGQMAVPRFVPPEIKPKKMGEKCEPGYTDHGLTCYKPGYMETGVGRGGSKELIQKAFDVWYNTRFNINPLSSDPPTSLAEKKAVPQELKDAVDKLKEVFEFLVRNMTGIKDVLRRAGLTSVISAVEKAGFGRHGRRNLRYIVKHVVRRAKGGAIDFGRVYDVASSTMGNSLVKAACNYNSSTKSACDGINKVLDVYGKMRENKDKIRAGIDMVPNVSQKNKDTLKANLEKVGLGVGLGRKGKRTPSARNMAVAKVMRERGVSLPEASRIVKAEGLA